LIFELKKSRSNLKVENNLTDYLIFQLIESTKSKKILILKLHLINNFEAKFEYQVKFKRVYKTPRTPRFKFFPENDKDIIEPNL
jgi:hypothetical protein